MQLNNNIKKCLTAERYNARDAQYLAHIISFGPVVFQTARLMLRYGIFEMLSDSAEGMTQGEIAERSHLSQYAAKCLLEASLTIGTVLIDTETDRYTLSKTGWFLLNDPLVRVDMDFNHDVNYEGWFHLDKALENGRPEGLKHFGSWATIYEGLSSLPADVQKSWFGFDHYYSDHSFDDALRLIFSQETDADNHESRDRIGKHVLDVGGNTGRFALRCVQYNSDARVTICDLPQQLELMKQAVAGKTGADRIEGVGMNLLDEQSVFPRDKHYDVIWMSQFLDCFSEKEIVSILHRAGEIMDGSNRLYIMETLWDRQRYLPAAFALTQISLYFTALANGNSKMYNTDDMTRLIQDAGLEIETIFDDLGMGGHSIIVCKK